MFNPGNSFSYPEEAGEGLGGGAIRQEFRTFGLDGFQHAPTLALETNPPTGTSNAIDAMPVRIGTGPEFIPATDDDVWILRETLDQAEYSSDLGVYLAKLYNTVAINAYVQWVRSTRAGTDGLTEEVKNKSDEELISQFTHLGIVYHVQSAADMINYRVSFWQEAVIRDQPLMKKLKRTDVYEPLYGPNEAGCAVGFILEYILPTEPYKLGPQHKPKAEPAIASGFTESRREDGSDRAFVIFRPSPGVYTFHLIPAFIPYDYGGWALATGAFVTDPADVPAWVKRAAPKAHYDTSMPTRTHGPGASDFDSPLIQFNLKTI